MRIDRINKRKADTCSGVSEIVGAILLISIVVVLIGVIGVYLFSQPVPQKIPNLNFMTGTNSDKTILYIYHNGGDTLNAGEFSVMLDGVPASYIVSGGGSWSLGKNLEVAITPATMPQSVQLVYNSSVSSGGPGSTGAVLLDQASVGVIRSGNVSPDQLPYLDCAAVRNWDCRFQIPPEIIIDRYVANSSIKRINLMKFDQGTGTLVSAPQNHFNITIGEPNATVVMGGSTCSEISMIAYPLTTNDHLDVTFPSDPTDFYVYGSAPQIWEMGGGGLSNIVVTLTYENGSVNKITGRRLCHTYVPKYSAFDSTLVLQTDGTNKMTTLVVNDTRYIEGVYPNTITLRNFGPTDNGLFLISSPGGGATFFSIGWADTIEYGGIPQTGLGI